MKNLLLVLLLILLSSCSNSKTEQIASKKSDKIEQNFKGLTTCNCPAPFDKAEHQIKIAYQDNYLKFCAFEFSQFERAAAEFRIFDKNDSTVFTGDAPLEYKISDFKAPLNLVLYTGLAVDDTGELTSIPAVDFQIIEKKGAFEVKEKFVMTPPGMTRQKMDSLLTIFRKQPEHHDKYDEKDPPFASEEFEMALFVCAINGNQECLQAFENLETRFATDGAIAELYSELSYLVQVYKNDLNKH